MSIIQSSLIPATGGDFTVDQSLRFDQNRTTSLSRTPASAGNRTTWTYSVWMKLGQFGDGWNMIFNAGQSDGGGSAGTRLTGLLMYNTTLYIYWDAANGATSSAMKLRDNSAWYHVCLVANSSSLACYINGTLAGTKSGSGNGAINNTQAHAIGSRADVANSYFNGLMSEAHFIDGVAKAPADFAEIGDYGEWKPIEYSGSYGTNGFYLPFKQDYTVEGFSAVTWTGNGSTSAYGRYIGGVGFNPDMIWIKCRTDTFNHIITNKAFGYNKHIKPNTADALVSQTHNIEGFQTDGFTLGHQGQVNSNGDTFVAWNWDFGNTEVTNNNGSTTGYTVPNAAYGQSVITYTGTGSNATIGHGLSAAPDMIIVKNTNTSSRDWVVYHSSLGNTKNLRLNETDAVDTEPAYWNNTTPSSSVFYVGNGSLTNENTKSMLAYCFTSVSGYSKFGSYTGDATTNNSKSVTLGFQPAFLMVKKSSGTGNWVMVDNTRNPNVDDIDLYLKADTNDVEATQSGNLFKFTSTGFTIGANLGDVNANGATYVYMAFADKREYAYWLDQSGNNNDWTSNNLTESDVMVDSPSNNFPTMNPLFGTNQAVLSEANLKATYGSGYCGNYSTMTASSGKWYAEYLVTRQVGHFVGVWSSLFQGEANPQNNANKVTYLLEDGRKVIGTTFSSYGSALAVGDILSIKLDQDNHVINFAKNGTFIGDIALSGTVVGTLDLTIGGAGRNDTGIWNFGQDSSFAGARTAQGNQDSNGVGDFFYAPPTGFLALCTKNLPAVAVVPSEHFNSLLYTGNNANNRAITGVGFTPNLVWVKSRPANSSHNISDSVRGNNKILFSNSTAAEATPNTISSLNSDGFTVGDGNGYDVNKNGESIVAWNWKANGSGSTNTAGTINSTVSANVDAGFSIVKYTAESDGADTVGHGLSKAPEIVFWKARNKVEDWLVTSTLFSNSARNFIKLNTTAAVVDYGSDAYAFTASTIRAATRLDDADNYIAYAFHSVDGYSKVGSYTGNGNNDGTFVYTGFRPAWLMVKSTNNTTAWWIIDNKRSPFNPADETLYPNLTNAEETWGSAFIDFTSNGFKLRYNHGILNNGNYIYLAFSKTPFKYSNAR